MTGSPDWQKPPIINFCSLFMPFSLEQKVRCGLAKASFY